MLIRLFSLAAATTLLGTAALVAPEAQACGGFFCNSQTGIPVYQQGERVLFAQYDGLVTMHIEVMYGGEDPTKFAWLLPVPDIPKGIDGQPLPLDKAVSVSIPELFDRLQTMTNPQFTVNRTADNSFSGCLNGPSSFNRGFADAGSWSFSDVGAPSAEEPPPVEVLEEAKIGPYDAQLIEANSSDALFEWLNENGYFQDPSAKPLLGYYLSLGFKFIGIRLQADKQNDDLKPLALRLGENAPCVPLRLTSIAAAPDMPILVWVAGNGRAVPKNFLHAEVNPMAINTPAADNYVDVVSEAIDTAAGRAWVTEFSGSTDTFKDMFTVPVNVETTLSGVESLLELLQANVSLDEGHSRWVSLDGYLDAFSHYSDIMREEIPKPEGLRGYPYGDCWYAEGGGGCERNSEHVTTDAEFYNYLSWWVVDGDIPAGTIKATDLERLKSRLIDEVIVPLRGVDEVFEKTTTLTRFFTTIDPENMTKDPIFAFNPELPSVSNTHTINTVVYGSGIDTCGPGSVVATYDDGSSYSWGCEGFDCWGQALTVDRVVGASALKALQVLDETGQPVMVDPTQAEEVDTFLDDAVAGTPSLTEQERASIKPVAAPQLPPGALPPGAPIPTTVTQPGSRDGVSSSGCEAGASHLGFYATLACVLALFIARRREQAGA